VFRHHTDVDAPWLASVLSGMSGVHAFVETANVRPRPALRCAFSRALPPGAVQRCKS
jgi:hypothetical protein